MNDKSQRISTHSALSRRRILFLSLAAFAALSIGGPWAVPAEAKPSRRTAKSRSKQKRKRARRPNRRATRRGRKATNTAKKAQSIAKNARKTQARNTVGDPKGERVLGRYPHYLKKARVEEGQAYDNPHWKQQADQGNQAKLPRKDRIVQDNRYSQARRLWQANRKFLDAGIRKRERFRLASEVPSFRGRFKQPGQWYRMELRHLQRHGYSLSPDGKYMIPPKR